MIRIIIVKVPTDEPNGITVTIPYSEGYSENRINSLIEDVIKFGGILANDNEDIELDIVLDLILNISLKSFRLVLIK